MDTRDSEEEAENHTPACVWGKGQDKQQWEKMDGEKRQSAGKGRNHHMDCDSDRHYRKKEGGWSGITEINRSRDDRLTVTILHMKT